MNYKEDKFWSRKYLLLGSLFSAGINFINSLLFVKFLSFEIFGEWLFLKGWSQVVIIFGLGIGSLFLTSKKKDIQIQKGEFFSGALMLAPVYILSLFIFFKYFLSIDLVKNLSLLLLVLSIYLSGTTTQYLRGIQNGMGIFIGNLIESILGAFGIILFFIGINIVEFIVFQGCRFLLKFIVHLKFINGLKLLLLPIKKLFNLVLKAFPVHLKNSFQSIAQYADKILLPLIFSYELNGVFGIGSNIALPLIMVISTSAVILIPKVVNSTNVRVLKYSFKVIITQVIFLGLISSLFIPFFLFFLPNNTDLNLLSFGFFLITITNILQMSSLWFFRNEKIYQSTLISLILFLSSYLLLFTFNIIFESLEIEVRLILILVCEVILTYIVYALLLKIHLNELLYFILNFCFFFYYKEIGLAGIICIPILLASLYFFSAKKYFKRAKLF